MTLGSRGSWPITRGGEPFTCARLRVGTSHDVRYYCSDIRAGRKHAGQSLDGEPSDRHERNIPGTLFPFGKSLKTLRCPGHDFEQSGIYRAESNVIWFE